LSIIVANEGTHYRCVPIPRRDKGGDHRGFDHGGFQGGMRGGYIRIRGRRYGGGRPIHVSIVVS
jgi:hypothetical protein